MQRYQNIASFLENISVLKQLMRRVHKTDAKHTITPAQVGILFTVHQEGPQSIKTLSTVLGLSSSAVTQLVDSLVDEKLLTRTEDKVDRRKISVTLTPRGKKKLLAAKKLHLATLTKLLAVLSDREVQELCRLQQKIIVSLT